MKRIERITADFYLIYPLNPPDPLHSRSILRSSLWA